jgi:hypothetical protein
MAGGKAGEAELLSLQPPFVMESGTRSTPFIRFPSNPHPTLPPSPCLAYPSLPP